MTKRSIILTLIAAALLVPSTDAAASVFKKKKKKAQTEATAAQKPAPKKKQTPYEKLMKEKGVTISEIDTKPFVASTAFVYDKLGYGDLRKQVDTILGR